MIENKDIEKRVVKKYITITDCDVWDMIDQIMTVEGYSKSFNKVINEALKYGIVELYEKLFIRKIKDDESTSEEINVLELKEKSKEKNSIEDLLKEIVVMLKEDFLNIAIIKATTNSLYEMKNCEVNKEHISSSSIDRGWYAQTPKFLKCYELTMLNNLQGKKK